MTINLLLSVDGNENDLYLCMCIEIHILLYEIVLLTSIAGHLNCQQSFM